MNTPIWPAVGALTSARNLCYEWRKEKENANHALIGIHTALIVLNAAVFKSTLDKWRDP